MNVAMAKLYDSVKQLRLGVKTLADLVEQTGSQSATLEQYSSLLQGYNQLLTDIKNDMLFLGHTHAEDKPEDFFTFWNQFLDTYKVRSHM
jgi:hypothetical protein